MILLVNSYVKINNFRYRCGFDSTNVDQLLYHSLLDRLKRLEPIDQQIGDS